MIKGRQLKLDDEISSGDLLITLSAAGVELSRGLLRIRQLVAIGKGVVLRSKRCITLGKGVSLGDYCYLDGLGRQGITIGQGSAIGRYSSLKVSGTLTDLGEGIRLGDNVGIGEFAHIGGAGGVSIGSNTIVGAYFSVHPENHVFEDKDKLIREQGVSREGIEIGEDCWIGAKVSILDGARVGNGCVIAAGAVVKGQFGDNVVIGGIPAKVLKYR